MKVKLLGSSSKEELENRIQKIAAAGKLSRFDGNVFEVIDSCNDYEKNLKLIKRIIKMGHKSIIEHDYVVFALCDVTPIVEQTIIGNRLTSFTIKSRREVDFRNVDFFVPEFRNKDLTPHKDNQKLQDTYKKHMKILFNTYGEFVDNGINVEDARFILPYCFYSNIIMGLDCRELEKLTVSLLYGPLSKIAELKELGNQFLEIIKTYIPYLVDEIENCTLTNENPFELLEKNSTRPEIEIIDKPKLLNYTPDADNTILKSHIMYHYQCSSIQAVNILNNMEKENSNIRKDLMNIITHKEERRELEQVSYTFQIPISLSILTHLTRHRMHSLLVPEFLPMWNLENYVTPPTISASSQLPLFKKMVSENMKIFEEFKKENIADEDLIYFYLGCQMLNVITTFNARTAQWICRLRCCNKAQWQIRNIAKEFAKQIKEVSPLIGERLGATCTTDLVCHEGRECCGLIDKLLNNK